MFSHTINNPNDCVINNNNYYVIPFGHRCSSALACKYANLRKFSLPFDWTRPLFPQRIQRVLENNFLNFIPEVPIPDRNNGDSVATIYGFNITHFNSNIKDGIDEYRRRIDRFNTIMAESNKKYFIYINEDYLYDNDYRQDELNDTLFSEMLELEFFLKDKYPSIDYNIIYFNFRAEDIPRSSKIINVILNRQSLINW